MRRSPHADYRNRFPRHQGLFPCPSVPRLLTGLVGIATCLSVYPVSRAEPTATPASASAPSRAASVNASREAKPSVTNGSERETRIALKPVGGKTSATIPSRESRSADEHPMTVPIAEARRMIAECKARYAKVSDYSCDFYKRERINGKLTELHVMSMKERTRPKSLYFKFQQPNRGREAIFVAGKNNGNILAHDVGITKFLAGTMELDPAGSRAMENNRHPITEAGIGELIETVSDRWSKELSTEHSVINHVRDLKVGPHTSVVMIESTHPGRQPDFLFYRVRLYIDQSHGLPIRFEAYDWPKQGGSAPELLEEYTYLNLKLNSGLSDTDFDAANEQYSFGRF